MGTPTVYTAAPHYVHEPIVRYVETVPTARTAAHYVEPTVRHVETVPSHTVAHKVHEPIVRQVETVPVVHTAVNGVTEPIVRQVVNQVHTAAPATVYQVP